MSRPGALRIATGGGKLKSLILLALLACVLLPGCTVWQSAKRTLCGEPSEFWWMADRKRSFKVYKSWADQAWCTHGASGCGDGASGAYKVGFLDGFVDFVYAGGSGEPPPVPPRQFWNVGNRKPSSHAKAADWFAGYRHGARVARDEGYRDQAVVPASVFFGPKEDCWEDEPCCVETGAPLPDFENPELLPPGQLESGFDAVDSVPILSSDDNELTEEMPPPDRVPSESDEPQIPEAMELPTTVPDPAPIPESPGKGEELEQVPESERDIERLFDGASPTVSTMQPKRRRASQMKPAQAAFAAAVRRSAKGAGKLTPTQEQIQQAQHIQQLPQQRDAETFSQAVRPHAIAGRTTNLQISPATATARSDDRAEQMFRRLSK